MRNLRRAAVTLVAAAIASGALAATASGSPGWIGPIAISPEGVPVESAVASDANGTAIFVWRNQAGRIAAVDRPAGSRYGTIRLLSQATADQPTIAMNAAGDTFVAWCRGNRLELAVRAGSRFSVDLPPLGDCTGNAGPPHLAAGPNRSALVVWTHDTGAGCIEVQAHEVRISGATYARVGSLTTIPGCGAGEPQVAQNARGDAAVLYAQGSAARLATRTAGDQFGAADTVSPAAGGTVSNPAVAVNENGLVASTWRRSVPHRIEAATNLAGVSASTGRPISNTSAVTAGPPDVAFDGTGAATVAWVDNLPPRPRARTATKAPSATMFAAPQTVPNSDFSPTFGNLDLDAGPAGELLLVFVGPGPAAYSARRAPGASFSPAARYSAPGEFISGLHLAMDREGNGISTMSAQEGTSHMLKAAGYDASGPRLRSVGVPSRGVAGQPLTFTVNPFDVWSAVSTTWNFGDGTGTFGTTANHVYGAPGTYTAMVTGTDAFGNATSAQGAVQIAPWPVPDSDGDGFRDDQDCKPFNPSIHPGAREIPENRVDENCDGPDARYPRIDRPAIAWAWNAKMTRFRLRKLEFEDIPNGTRAHARCGGKRCTFEKTKSKRARRHKLNLLPLLKGKRRFRPGQTLEVRATRDGYMGRVSRVKLKAGEIPDTQQRCLKPGTKKPRKCR